MKKYLLLDTNIYVESCIIQLKNGDTMSILSGLLSLLDKNEIKLILPATVVFEFKFRKVSENKLEKMAIQVEEYLKNIDNMTDLDENVKLEINRILKHSKIKEKINKIISKRQDN
jgi:hypothetical protein